MIDIEKIKKRIIECLKPVNPETVILFGSYAYGNPEKDSDIDLYVVTDDDFLPKNYDEKIKIKLKIARQLDDIMKEIPTDLIVHTKKMNKKFIELNSYFSRKILSEGIRLI